MKRLLFRASATADLRAIATATRKRWGQDQAARYVARLREDIKGLRAFSERFVQAEPGYRGLRKMTSGRHIVFYLVTRDAVVVIRILHGQMDFGLHLD